VQSCISLLLPVLSGPGCVARSHDGRPPPVCIRSSFVILSDPEAEEIARQSNVGRGAPLSSLGSSSSWRMARSRAGQFPPAAPWSKPSSTWMGSLRARSWSQCRARSAAGTRCVSQALPQAGWCTSRLTRASVAFRGRRGENGLPGLCSRAFLAAWWARSL